MNKKFLSLAASNMDLWLYRLATGLSVAAVVYHQSMTNVIASGLDVSPDALWTLSVATQVGYGLGLLLGLPLGDVLAPRRFAPSVIVMLGIVLILQSLAPSLWLMICLCFIAGLLSIGGQLLIAHASRITAAGDRARVVGSLLSSLFAGLLLARTLSGWGSEQIGWRGFYLVMGGATCVIGLMLKAQIQDDAAGPKMRYPELLRSQVSLWFLTSELRHLAFIAACFFAALNGIWANLASLIHSTLHWPAAKIGLLALTGIAGLGAPTLVDFLQKKLRWTSTIALLGMSLSIISIVGFFAGPTELMIIAYLVLSDLIVRSAHVLTQGRTLAINPAASGRLNSLFMTVFFLGAAIGSWLGGIASHMLSWFGMFLFSLFCAVAGVAVLGVSKAGRIY